MSITVEPATRSMARVEISIGATPGAANKRQLPRRIIGAPMAPSPPMASVRRN